MIHLVTLGAGGGSIASYNRLYQSIAVGPLSAGSDPGPACYDRGGMRPTVTDGDVLLGYLDPAQYAGGRIPLNIKRASFAIEEEFGDHLDLEPVDVAKLIKAEVDEQMANGMAKELRVRAICRQEFTMLAYGGNGPLHCCGIAKHLGIDRVLAPPYSSVFSALGAGNTPQLHIHERTAPGCFSTRPAAACSTTSTRSTRSWPTWRRRDAPTCCAKGCPATGCGTVWNSTCATATSS